MKHWIVEEDMTERDRNAPSTRDLAKLLLVLAAVLVVLALLARQHLVAAAALLTAAAMVGIVVFQRK